ncbi:MAG: ABC transporter substrate-binding protein [Clostridia bacterium]|nr:ABC transporter substrate-binding protein [Clostridia bacterium]
MLKASSSANKILFFLIAILVAVLLVSCANGNSNDMSTDTDTVTDEVNPISFTDALGRDVTIERPPERVAALIGSFADVWLLAGGNVCATAEDAWDDFGLELDGAVSIGSAHSTNTEKLLSASPDLVLASASTASNVNLLETLESAGITVAYFDVDCFEDYLEMLHICTRITGRDDLYNINGLLVKEKIDAIKEDFNRLGLTDEERTVLLLRASSGFVKAKGSEGTILGEMLADIGCINIADSDSSLLEDLSVEAVIRRDPRHVFVVTMGDDTDGAIDNFNAMIKDNSAWATLDAIKNGRVHFMDRHLFNIKPNAKWWESYEQLCDIFKD